ncbi:homeobox-leucine zipper protein ROC8-like isoform X2 [Lycium barbarum]|uniref:homeobox-leucine zipper protein ROC8-like isoform X2 n=1 Tax=Lycium barbarum TaxID=112863 RepID=UPI00293EE4DA|nr:homeobox-leucine zipper protein ROC8-like isoform X2 [Lycium barbarum]
MFLSVSIHQSKEISKEMADSREEHVGESIRPRRFQRHSVEQIQRLKGFFKECQYPDEDQRIQLGREVGLDPKQIKYWFQNRRARTKVRFLARAVHETL